MMKGKNIAILIVVLVIAAGVGYVFFVGPTARVPVAGPTESTDASVTPAPSVISLDDNGKTFQMAEGGRVTLKLGEMDWNVSISDPTVISRVVNIMVVRGAQGVYTAKKPGTAVISAEGRPHCNSGQMCAQYIVNFTATVIVK